ncbi:VOC family protein [Kitasatospora sp. MAP5-34]|uniref:VOC family protein n=1 Tax=Kitasatospora sp. MAP5-34 TaxID=3035102 RepID=UPI002473DC9D|nr:VOC family protein [Kitasatospora sp. MAP5-34]MDH6580193.1 putative enzyme related to lactoylglutathione lyase [Kitasatospora sp. MAP5-34]
MTAVKVRLAQGTPCWVSLMTSDQEGAMAFYGTLLGWEYTPGPTQLGAYVRATLGGAKVAGIGSTPPPGGHRAEWTTYFAVDNADEVSQRVNECGGTVAVGPLQAEHAGRLAIAADLSGAVFGLWQGEEHLGWEVSGEPGAPAWSELLTPDVPAAAVFYRAVLGQDPSPDRDGNTALLVDGRPVAGIRRSTTPSGGGRPHWQVHFAVADADLTVRQTVGLGGQVSDGPQDTPYGRVAWLNDPQGGRFAVVQLPDTA